MLPDLGIIGYDLLPRVTHGAPLMRFILNAHPKGRYDPAHFIAYAQLVPGGWTVYQVLMIWGVRSKNDSN